MGSGLTVVDGVVAVGHGSGLLRAMEIEAAARGVATELALDVGLDALDDEREIHVRADGLPLPHTLGDEVLLVAIVGQRSHFALATVIGPRFVEDRRAREDHHLVAQRQLRGRLQIGVQDGCPGVGGAAGDLLGHDVVEQRHVLRVVGRDFGAREELIVQKLSMLALCLRGALYLHSLVSQRIGLYLQP